MDKAINGMLKQVLACSINGPKSTQEAGLLAMFAPDEDNKLHLACEVGDAAVVATILAADKADVNMRIKDGSTPLIIASARGHEQVSQLLIQSEKATLNSEWMGNGGCSPLLLWCQHGNATIVNLLVSQGASVNLADDHGRTPIFAAAAYNHTHLLPLLLEHHADCNSKHIDGSSPLSVAAEKGHVGVLEILYRHGGDLSARLTSGATCLTLAAQNGHTEVVTKLLEWECPANVIDHNGYSPLFMAAAYGRLDMIGMIFVDNIEHRMNPFEVALCAGMNQAAVLLLRKLLQAFCPSQLTTPVEPLMTLVMENIQRAHENHEKDSYTKWLGIEDVSVTLREDAGPTGSSKQPKEAFKASPEGVSSTSIRQKGNVLFQQKRFREAIVVYEQAMALVSNCPLAASNAAEAAIQLHDYAGAHDFALQALA